MSGALSREQYQALVNPRAVALVGVSERTGPQAYNLIENLDEAGAACRIYPVNRRAREIVGRASFVSLADIPDAIDLAVVSTPRDAVPGVIRECVAKKVPAVVVATQGFSDADAEGHRLQAEIDAILAGSGTRLVGPNTIGVANLFDRFHTSFQRFDLDCNPTAWLCQSGAFLLGAAEFSGGLGIGIDVGNGADVDFTDLLPWLAADDRVRVINLHVEGVRGGAAFLAACAAITPAKPIVALKTGRSAAGARAAISHSGSLAGEDHVFAAAFRKAGVLRAASVEEVADLNKALLRYPAMRGRRVAVLTISGGAGIAAIDALEGAGLEVAALAPATLARLHELGPAWFEVGNPVDFWPAAMRGGFAETCVAMLDILLADPGVDALLFVIPAYRATGFTVIGPVLEAIAARAAARRDVPVACWIFGANRHAAIGRIEENGAIAAFTSPERAARALAGLHRYLSAVRGRTATAPAAIGAVHRERAAAILDRAQAAATRVIGSATLELLAAYGIPVAPVRSVAGRDALAAAARALGFPLVMKIASVDVVHKSDAGGVHLDIRDEAALVAAYDAMLAAVRRAHPQARIQGVHLQRFHAGGTEVIIGARRDPQFGPVIVCGLGGIHTEVLKDVSFRLAPLTHDEAREMIGELRSIAILQGARGAAPADLDALADCAVRLARLMSDFPSIAEIDVNPLAAGPAGAIALDARAVMGAA